MPYPIPTLTSLIQQGLQDVQAAQITNAGGTTIVGLLQKAVLRVLVKAIAAFTYGLYGQQSYIAQQSTPWGATGENAIGWGALKNIQPLDATQATGTAYFTSGAAPETGTIPAGSQINRSSDGTAYLTTVSGAFSGGVCTVPIQAILPGIAGTIQAGDLGALVTPIGGISPNCALTSVAPGTNQETESAFKARYLQAYANPSQGGAGTDYVGWALAADLGVTRAWVIPTSPSAGCVTVYFMEDVVRASYGGFPQGSNGVSPNDSRNTGSSGAAPIATGDQLALANALYPLRPVTALVYADAPSNNPINFTFSTLSPNTAAIQAAITAALQQMFLQVATPGGTTRPDGQTGGTIFPSDWDTAISNAAGVDVYAVSSPSAAVTSSTGALPSLGTITW